AVALSLFPDPAMAWSSHGLRAPCAEHAEHQHGSYWRHDPMVRRKHKQIPGAMDDFACDAIVEQFLQHSHLGQRSLFFHRQWLSIRRLRQCTVLSIGKVALRNGETVAAEH